MSTSLDLCLRLFPYVICLDDTGVIIYVSDKLAARLGESVKGETLATAFTVLNPAPNALDCSTITAEHVGKLFLMRTRDKRFALRGQIIDGTLHSKDVFFFVGAPWSSWLYENGRRVALNADEFPIQDSQLEHQMYLTTQNIMRADLEELGAARTRAESANRAKTEFVKHISHEIRTPLNGVITSLSLLSDPQQALRYDRLLEIAKSSANALMDLVDDVLDFSRIEEGMTGNTESEFDLPAFSREVEAAFSTRALEREIQMRFFLANDLPQWIKCDKRSLQKIAFNLISNAIKYSKSAVVEVKFSLELEGAAGEAQAHLFFECRDYGVGIPKGDHAAVFEPFWTAQDVKQGNEQSTGLGLSITQELTSLLGGTLTLESELGAGAAFQARIPVTVLNESAARPKEAAVRQEEVCYSGTVLLVDDNNINLELGVILLERLGLRVDVATDGKEALDRATTHHYDLLFMDISMPVMGGIEASERLLAVPGKEGSVIIALTANASREDIASYAQAGMRDTLIKPIEQPSLQAICATYLQERHASSEALSTSEHELTQTGDTSMGDTTILDPSKLKQLEGDLGEDNFVRIAGLFLKETRVRNQELATLLSEDDFEAIGGASHRLASSCLAFGLQALGDTLREAESAAREEQRPTLGAAELDTLCARSLEQLEDYLARR